MTNEEETPNCKVVLLGETGVGKSSFINSCNECELYNNCHGHQPPKLKT